MRKILIVALLATSTLPVAAQAQQAAAQANATAGAAKSDLDRITCEREEQIGSRLGARKVCKTVREWQEQRRVQREEVEGVQRVINQNQPGG